MSIDKSKWGPGPWQDEQDRVEFRAHGLPCLLARHQRFGHWCMYVGVPPGHPWHGKDYDSITVEAHGGLTYSAACDGDPVDGICHVPLEGEPEHAWWVGVDFAHAWDFSPGMEARTRTFSADRPTSMDERYWTQAEVKAECERLAEEAAAAVNDEA